MNSDFTKGSVNLIVRSWDESFLLLGEIAKNNASSYIIMEGWLSKPGEVFFASSLRHILTVHKVSVHVDFECNRFCRSYSLRMDFYNL